MKVYQSIDELVGKTPLLRANNLEKALGLKSSIYLKLEYLNPAGSVKDRAALYMLNGAEKQGKLKRGGTIIEPTSGNTGIGLSALGVSRGYKVVLTMPNTMSVERIKLLKAYGAEIVLTDGALGMKGAIDKANEIQKNTPNSVIMGQFENKDNPKAHYETTAKEIYEDLDGNIDVLVAGFGTGGTVSGCGRFLKEKNEDIEIVAVEPLSSPLISQGKSGAHKIQGIGANFIPENFEKKYCDQVIAISDEDAYNYTKVLAKTEGILVGISSGASLAGAIEKARALSGKNIVVILPDTGDRYLSVDGLF